MICVVNEVFELREKGTNEFVTSGTYEEITEFLGQYVSPGDEFKFTETNGQLSSEQVGPVNYGYITANHLTENPTMYQIVSEDSHTMDGGINLWWGTECRLTELLGTPHWRSGHTVQVIGSSYTLMEGQDG